MPIPSKQGDDGSVEMPIQGVFPVNLNTDPMTYVMPIDGTISSGFVNIGLSSSPAQVANMSDFSAFTSALTVKAGEYVAKGNNLELVRTPSIFKTGTANAIGSTALWTPAAGKKFRVMGYTFTLPSTATSAAGTVITLKDDATSVFTIIVMGTTSGALSGSVELPGNGYLSTAADNVLNINCSAALTAGQIAVSVWGTEE